MWWRLGEGGRGVRVRDGRGRVGGRVRGEKTWVGVIQKEIEEIYRKMERDRHNNSMVRSRRRWEAAD